MISEELLQSFIAEASDLLDDVEPSLVEYSRLDDAAERAEIFNRVFRHFHSIKGSAGFVGLHGIARLTHEAETLLEQHRKAPEKAIPRDDIALLCRTVDLLRAIFDSGGKDGDDLAVDGIIGEIVAATRAARGTGAGFVNLDAPPAPAGNGSVPADATQVVTQDTAHRIAEAVSEINPQGGKSAQGAQAKPASRDTAPPGRGPRVTKIRERGGASPGTPPGSATRLRNSETGRIIRNTEMHGTKTLNTAEFMAKYVSEANDLLEQIEQALLQAEQRPEAGGDAIQEAFRCLHSFKGNSGFMNLADLERLSHRMETEVENNIGRTLGIDTQTFDALLQMIDVLRQGVTDVSLGGSGNIPEADAYIAMMDEFAGNRVNTNMVKKATDASGSRVRPGRTDTDTTITKLSIPPKGKAEPGKEPGNEKKNTDTRSLDPKPSAPRAGSDTTRLVLRGKTSAQEDLRALPKSDNIVINTAPPDTRRIPARGAPEENRKPANTSATVRKKTEDGDAEKSGGRSAPDTGRKRRGAAQLAARNDIRVDLRKLDGMLDLVGELVIAEAMVTSHPVVWNADNESLERAVHQLRRVAGSLQDMATSVRMIPLAPTFRRMTRLVYDLSVKAGKQVDLILLGEETEVDRTVIERISDPLVHIIRNAIDHGIEPPEERAAAGKPETGRLTIEGHHEGGEVWIVITDDGRGLDKDAIFRRAISRGLVAGDGSDMTDNQIFHFIFEPGFSTAVKVTDISGRGFGMDVVKKNIEKLSGRIDIRTRPGEGTAVVLRIPLTLAIIDGMLVRSDETRYIIPLLSIRESLRPDMTQIMSTPDGQEMVKLRNELIPIVRLDETFSRVRREKDLVDGILMIVEGEDGDVVALFADELLGQQETVIKGLSGWLKKSRGVSGCTILGDGEVGLILDIGAIVRLVRQKYTA